MLRLDSSPSVQFNSSQKYFLSSAEVTTENVRELKEASSGLNQHTIFNT